MSIARAVRQDSLQPGIGAIALDRAAILGALIVLGMIVLALLAPWIAPYDPNHINLLERMQPPDWKHPAGTDEVGRDVLSRIIFGARASLAVGCGIVAIGASVGTLLGSIGGYRGGWPEAVLMRVMDASMSLPALVIGLALAAALGPSLTNAMLALGVLTIPHYTRLARAQALVIRESGYVMVSRSMGANGWLQLRRNILPNVLGPVIVYATSNIGAAILAGASLSFVGLGAQPPLAEWGSMVSSSRAQLLEHWWCPLFPGLAIAVTVMGFNLLGDGVRDVLDPRLRIGR
jgi:peptide/nickel transport system permease protein